MICNRTFLFLGLVALFCISSNAEIVQLTDEIFEHQTQASSGATTGSWFIMISSPACSSCAELKEAFEPLDGDSELYEQGIVLGQMDASSSTDTLARFDIFKLPTLMYIHKGSVYRFPLSEHEYRNTAVLKSFLLSDYKRVEAEPIPAPLTIWTRMEAAFDDVMRIASGSGGMFGVAMFGVAIGCLLLVMVFTVGILIYTFFEGNIPKANLALTPKSKKTPMEVVKEETADEEDEKKRR
jgi:uncharacterized membrane protein